MVFEFVLLRAFGRFNLVHRHYTLIYTIELIWFCPFPQNVGQDNGTLRRANIIHTPPFGYTSIEVEKIQTRTRSRRLIVLHEHGIATYPNLPCARFLEKFPAHIPRGKR